jgi:hypothetical protein
VGHLLVLVLLPRHCAIRDGVAAAVRRYLDAAEGERALEIAYFDIGGRWRGVLARAPADGVPPEHTGDTCDAASVPEELVPNALLWPDGRMRFFGWGLDDAVAAAARAAVRQLRGDQGWWAVAVDVKV